MERKRSQTHHKGNITSIKDFGSQSHKDPLEKEDYSIKIDE